jgi:hypothetical protein
MGNPSSCHLLTQLDVRHDEYRSHLLEYLHTRTLRHWDVAMRQIGAHSLRLLCDHTEKPELAETAMEREVRSILQFSPLTC